MFFCAYIRGLSLEKCDFNLIWQGWVLGKFKNIMAYTNNKLYLCNTHKEIKTKTTINNMQIFLFGVYNNNLIDLHLY